jgi:hypothetical protein
LSRSLRKGQDDGTIGQVIPQQGKDKTMCDICVMNRVKERMLSRRDFFKGTAALAGCGGGWRRGVDAARADGQGPRVVT